MKSKILFFKTMSFVSHFKITDPAESSFNHTIYEEIPKYVNNIFFESAINPSFKIRYSDFKIAEPVLIDRFIRTKLTPQKCLFSNLTYCAPIFATVHYSNETQKNIHIANIPLLVDGIYFIVKGIEKGILIFEQLANNRIYKRDNRVIVGKPYYMEVYVKDNIIYLTKNRQSVNIIKYLINHYSEEEIIRRNPNLLNSLLQYNGEKEINEKVNSEFLFFLIDRLFSAKTILDNNDFIGNKQYDSLGNSYLELFKYAFTFYNNQLIKNIDRVYNRPSSNKFDVGTFLELQSNVIGNMMIRALQTGNFNNKIGLTETLTRFSVISTYSLAKRIQSKFEKGRKVAEPRMIQPSSMGYICPVDTPEGEAVGLTKNLSLMTTISFASTISEEIVEHYIPLNNIFKYYLFINNIFKGKTNLSIIEIFRDLRRNGQIHMHVGVYTIGKAIYIMSTGCRLVRPFISIKGFQRKYNTIENIAEKITKLMEIFSIENLIGMGLVEYLDVCEYYTLNISQFRKFNNTDYMDFPEYLYFSIAASLIPYMDHNQSPRNTYQCAMGKQAISNIFADRFRCGDFNMMVYLSNPIIMTELENYLIRKNNLLKNQLADSFSEKNKNIDIASSGYNLMVAIASFSGYDIEDAVIINKGAIQRGLFRIVQTRTAVKENIFEENKNLFKGNKKDKFEIITPECVKYSQYQVREIEIGDKVSSRHGQKGVVGLIVDSNDCIFNEDGIQPDLIMNPHGFPSRMTIGKLLEGLVGKNYLIECKYNNSTVFLKTEFLFENINFIDDLNATINRGKEVFYCGKTGALINSYIFFAPIFYQRLKHLVADKIHSRSTGKRTALCRQPTEGRQRDGGLRFGEMERDCLISYGSSMLLYERLMDSSDKVHLNICKNCGLINNSNKCEYVKITVPYAFKVLIYEMMAMGVVAKIKI